MPPAAGYLGYEHVELRDRLHLLTEPVEDFKAGAVQEHNAMLSMLVDKGFLDPELITDETEHTQQIVEALYRGLKAAPSRLLAASLTDAVGERRTQNQPGTNNEYPNWRIPLADENGDVVPLEALFDNSRLQSLAAIMRA
jgi:4-alpha-glucanotransferase